MDGLTSVGSQPPAGRKVGILPCSGACNVGMMTTRAVVEISSERPDVSFVCALGLPLGIPGIIENAKKADYYLALNGCEVRCATKSLEKAGIKWDKELILTRDLGLPKNKNLKDGERLSDVIRIVNAAAFAGSYPKDCKTRGF